jgi:molybdopterin converting factor small subunit
MRDGMGTSRVNETQSAVCVTLKYLASIRDRTGCREESVCFPEGSTLRDVLSLLGGKYGIYLPDPQILLIVDGRGWKQLPVKFSTPLQSGNTICLLPPIAGG